jgi:tight adherence protein B
MEPLTLLVAILAAGSVLLIFLALAGTSDVNARLERYAATPMSDLSEGEKKDLGNLISRSAALGALNRVVERRDWATDMARELARADLVLRPSEFLAIRIAAVIGVPLGMIVLGSLGVVSAFTSPLTWVIGGVVGFFLPRLWLARRKSKRLKAFNGSLSDTITLLANSLRAGSSFLQSLELIVRETQPPISTEFARVIREVNLGLPLEEALANLQRRVRSDDLDLMTTAISIHHTVGGDLAEILDSIAFTIRERVRIKGEIATLTAQQKLSGVVVGLLPLGLMGALSVIAPHFLRPMFGPPLILGIPLGVIILAFGGLLMVIGFLTIRKVVDIKV